MKKAEVLNYKYVTSAIFFVVTLTILKYKIFCPPVNIQTNILATKEGIKNDCGFFVLLFCFVLGFFLKNEE